MLMQTRGRPAGTLTIRRRQVLQFIERRTEQGRAPTLGEIMRGCGLHGRSDAKRIMNDLHKIGLLPIKYLLPRTENM